MTDVDLESTVRTYMEAYSSRDLPRCLDFFAPDARIDFASGIYTGRAAIEEWHQDRFAADMRVLRIDNVKVIGDSVVVDLVATSKVVKQWRLNSLKGRVTLTFEGHKVKNAEFGLRGALPFEGW
jgi:hypothetical protein